MIGGKEVAVEAKEASLLKLNQQFAEETDPDRQQALLEQIAAVEAGIQELTRARKRATACTRSCAGLRCWLWSARTWRRCIRRR